MEYRTHLSDLIHKEEKTPANGNAVRSIGTEIVRQEGLLPGGSANASFDSFLRGLESSYTRPPVEHDRPSKIEVGRKLVEVAVPVAISTGIEASAQALEYSGPLVGVAAGALLGQWKAKQEYSKINAETGEGAATLYRKEIERSKTAEENKNKNVFRRTISNVWNYVVKSGLKTRTLESGFMGKGGFRIVERDTEIDQYLQDRNIDLNTPLYPQIEALAVSDPVGMSEIAKKLYVQSILSGFEREPDFEIIAKRANLLVTSSAAIRTQIANQMVGSTDQEIDDQFNNYIFKAARTEATRIIKETGVAYSRAGAIDRAAKSLIYAQTLQSVVENAPGWMDVFTGDRNYIDSTYEALKPHVQNVMEHVNTAIEDNSHHIETATDAIEKLVAQIKSSDNLLEQWGISEEDLDLNIHLENLKNLLPHELKVTVNGNEIDIRQLILDNLPRSDGSNTPLPDLSIEDPFSNITEQLGEGSEKVRHVARRFLDGLTYKSEDVIDQTQQIFGDNWKEYLDAGGQGAGSRWDRLQNIAKLYEDLQFKPHMRDTVARLAEEKGWPVMDMWKAIIMRGQYAGGNEIGAYEQIVALISNDLFTGNLEQGLAAANNTDPRWEKLIEWAVSPENVSPVTQSAKNIGLNEDQIAAITNAARNARGHPNVEVLKISRFVEALKLQEVLVHQADLIAHRSELDLLMSQLEAFEKSPANPTLFDVLHRFIKSEAGLVLGAIPDLVALKLMSAEVKESQRPIAGNLQSGNSRPPRAPIVVPTTPPSQPNSVPTSTVAPANPPVPPSQVATPPITPSNPVSQPNPTSNSTVAPANPTISPSQVVIPQITPTNPTVPPSQAATPPITPPNPTISPNSVVTPPTVPANPTNQSNPVAPAQVVVPPSPTIPPSAVSTISPPNSNVLNPSASQPLTVEQMAKQARDRLELQNSDPRNYYERLGVSPDATDAEILDSYSQFEATLRDFAELPYAEQQAQSDRVRAMNEAFSTLRNPAKRAAYDASLTNNRTNGQSATVPYLL